MPATRVRISNSAPSSTRVSPAPPRMKRVWLSTWSYSGSAGIEMNVITMKIPAIRATLLDGGSPGGSRGSRSVCSGGAESVMDRLLPGGEGADRCGSTCQRPAGSGSRKGYPATPETGLCRPYTPDSSPTRRARATVRGAGRAAASASRVVRSAGRAIRPPGAAAGQPRRDGVAIGLVLGAELTRQRGLLVKVNEAADGDAEDQRVQQQDGSAQHHRLPEYGQRHGDVHRVADVAVQATDDQVPSRRDGRRRADALHDEPDERIQQDRHPCDQDHVADHRDDQRRMRDLPARQRPWHQPGDDAGLEDQEEQTSGRRPQARITYEATPVHNARILLEPGRKLRELLAHLQAPTGSMPPVWPETSAPACELKPSLCVTQMVVRAHDQALPQAFLQIRCQCRNLNRAPLCRHSDIAILAPMTLLRQTYLHQIVTGLRADVLPADVAVAAPS